MKKKHWKRIIIIVAAVVILVSGFFLIVQAVKQERKINPSEEEEKKTLSDYKTGEVLTIQDAYAEAGSDKVTYIAFKINQDMGLDWKFRRLYFVCKEDLVQRVVEEINNTRFEVSNTSSHDITEEAKWELWLGISDTENIMVTAMSTLWEGISSCRFVLSQPGSYSVITEDFMWDYFMNGMFIEDRITDVLKDIVQNEITDISLEQAEKYAEEEGGPQLWEFRQYYYEESGYNENYDPIYKYELTDYDGYIMVEWSSMHYQEITSIALYDENDVLQKILYEHEIEE